MGALCLAFGQLSNRQRSVSTQSENVPMNESNQNGIAAAHAEIARLNAEFQDLQMLYEATIAHGEAVEDQLAEANILLQTTQKRLNEELQATGEQKISRVSFGYCGISSFSNKFMAAPSQNKPCCAALPPCPTFCGRVREAVRSPRPSSVRPGAVRRAFGG